MNFRGICLVFLLLVHGTAVFGDEGRGGRRRSVEQRGLVTELAKPRSIIKEHARVGDAATHRFGGRTLGFVTPWNPRGYEFAERYAGKLDYVVPVWHELLIVPSSDPKTASFRLAGSENVDLDWIRNLRAASAAAASGKSGSSASRMLRAEANSAAAAAAPDDELNGVESDGLRATAASAAASTRRGVKVLPRIILEDWPIEHYEALFAPAGARAAANLLRAEARSYGYDGFFLELRVSFSDSVLLALHIMAKELHEAGLQIGVAYGMSSHVVTKDLQIALFRDMDVLQIVSYDYSTRLGTAGPVAPIDWVRQLLVGSVPPVVKAAYPDARSKLFLGLNFYGYRYKDGGMESAVVASEYLELLARPDAVLEWDNNACEHVLHFHDDAGARVSVWFPTLRSIHDRMELAAEMGANIGIWDLGQGLEYFYDLL